MDKDKRTALIREASDWLTRLEEGDQSDRAAFTQWLQEDVAHVEQVLKLQAIRTSMARTALATPGGLRSSGDNAVVVFPLSGPAARAPVSKATEPLPARSRVATLVACFLLYVLLVMEVPSRIAPTYETVPGETRVVLLPDGTRAHLNSATLIQVTYSGTTRLVSLQRGEALFDVAPDATRPFRVQSSGMTADALGTQFDMKLNSGELSLLVHSGRVAIRTGHHHASVLQANDLARVSLSNLDGRLSIARLTSYQAKAASAWTGSVVFTGSPLQEAVDRFNRANVLQLVVDDAELFALPLGGQFTLTDPQTFADALRWMGVRTELRQGPSGEEIHLSRAPSASQADRDQAASDKGSSVVRGKP